MIDPLPVAFPEVFGWFFYLNPDAAEPMAGTSGPYKSPETVRM